MTEVVTGWAPRWLVDFLVVAQIGRPAGSVDV